jgi:hypothetical protein
MTDTTKKELPLIKLMSAKDMVKEYNFLTGKNTTKFSSRPQGENQLVQARLANPEKLAELYIIGEEGLKTEERAAQFIPPEKPVKSSANRSEAIAKTWKDAKVAAKRAKRDSVTVDGAPYKSVLAAFRALRLPIEKHIKFRMELKAAGALEFAGKKFVVIKQGTLAV